MPSVSHLYSGRRLLPPCDGPKLGPFKLNNQPITFEKLLSDNYPTKPSSFGGTSSSLGAGCSYVFQANIGDSKYAIKIFKFYHLDKSGDVEKALKKDLTNESTIIYNSDPFYAECRAYGKIRQYQEHQGRELRSRKWKRRRNARTTPLAVPCYGYLFLQFDDYSDLFRDDFGVSAWDRTEEDDIAQIPLRGLVKQLMNDEEPLRNPRQMLRDLDTLLEIDVWQRDVFVRNYLEGLLIDFDIAWTKPHWMFLLLSQEQLNEERQEHYVDYDNMFLEVYGRDHIAKVRATVNVGYRAKLRGWSWPGRLLSLA
ncbi:hypothetical protein EJ05DRAFT_471663 [Pseudovirgaria hyperparasitica]|uniref:Protein kinase domain-containing protein n=1 Tax=Pseudovirgaria hyperparasitica TaxID=470096 RepID=A0A6A6WKL3_9PEZI|nr:uncharacterized protein EJ05DRAFT_471663 [Pseudovirgaria hyperparasitica]KAF2762706.1 hypothetical protein EJ05DRAFT_471663 [Pseudovirgaria hyperparasitica]